MTPPPAPEHGQRRLRLLEMHELPQRIRVTGELGNERSAQGHQGRIPRLTQHPAPALRSGREQARLQERYLAGPGGADEGQETLALEPLPQRLDLGFSPEEGPPRPPR
jgi:hypothetical protein